MTASRSRRAWFAGLIPVRIRSRPCVSSSRRTSRPVRRVWPSLTLRTIAGTALPSPAAPTAGRGSASRPRRRSTASGRRWSTFRPARSAGANTPIPPTAGSTPRTSPARGAARASGWSRPSRSSSIPHSASGNPQFQRSCQRSTRPPSCFAQGMILAMKGIGGFHLLCDATSRRRGPAAPRAEEARSQALRRALPGPGSGRGLTPSSTRPAGNSWSARPHRSCCCRVRPGSTLAEEVAPGLSTVGAFLAYTPLHRALVRRAGRPLVATSANLTDEPMPVENDVARDELRSIADWMLLHDRRILRHSDDSVLRLIGGKPVPIRVGRGLAPLRIVLPIEPPPLLATGGHLKSAIAVTRGKELFLGQHIGDLDTQSARRRYQENVADLPRLFGVAPSPDRARPASRLLHDPVRRGAGLAAPGRAASSRPRHGLSGRARRERPCAGDCLGRHRLRR